ncbi:MAG: UDP-2,3-diacylglucosamine diphosphatase LpxI [Pirellulaceae bacterium]|nr:UDP-2,3-diacylglucosamine diphosphatase LpxI [Pirellulaceae bacterium]
MNRQPDDEQSSKRIGLIAGWGRFPLYIAQTLKQSGYEVFGVSIKGHTDENLAPYCVNHVSVSIARVGKIVRHFQRNQVKQATMAGKIHKVEFFKNFAWLSHFPDLFTLKTFFPHFISQKKSRQDDSLLLAIVRAFASKEISMKAATDFAPELLVKEGILTKNRPSISQLKDIAFGWEIAKQMGDLDIGQSIVVKGQNVLAVEAIEGTDQCILRGGRLCPQGGFTLIKVAKPGQDMRFDVPTVGVKTLHTLKQAGGTCLAIEADKTILLDEKDFLSLAKKLKISVVSLTKDRDHLFSAA